MNVSKLVKQMTLVFLLTILSTYTSLVFAKNSALTDYTYLGEFSQEKANLTFQKTPPLESLKAKYTLNLYKIHYKTPAPDGSTTIASGLVAMPIAPTKPVSLISYHHGTRVTRNDVPSNNAEKNYIYPAVFGSYAGYMLSMPDYLGLGDSTLSLHPYVQADTLASSSINMLIAAKELANALNYPISDKLYLAGYSEGGFTTTVTYEALLKNDKHIKVTAVSPGSAPYDWKETMPFLLQTPGPRATLYAAYFFYSLQTYYHFWSSMDAIYKAPYDKLIPTLFDGQHQSTDILEALPANPHDILQEAFFDGLLNGTDKNIDKLIENFNHYDFTATSPFLMIGTKGDHDVPYHGAEIAYNVLKQKSDLVSLKSVSDELDHLQAFPYITKAQMEFFQQYEG